jgi:hypothetical protein
LARSVSQALDNIEEDRHMIEKVLKPQLLWATPTLTVELKSAGDLNEGLARIVLEKEQEIVSKGNPTTVAGVKDGLTAHWLEYNVLNWQYPEIEEFRRHVLGGLQEYFKMIADPDDPGLAEYLVGRMCCGLMTDSTSIITTLHMLAPITLCDAGKEKEKRGQWRKIR